MSQLSNRKRSATTNVNASEPNAGSKSPAKGRTRFYSISSDIIPQTLTHPDDEETLKSPKNTIIPPSWSHVGFQSIYQGGGGGQRRSKNSSKVNTSTENSSVATDKSAGSSSSLVPRTDHHRSEEDLSSESIHTGGSSTKGKIRSAILGMSKENHSFGDRSSRIFRTSTNKSNSSFSGPLLKSPRSNNGNSLSSVARKLFKHKKHKGVHNDDNEAPVPTSLSKFLHSSYARHKSPSQFMHNAAVDGKSGHSFHPNSQSTQNDKRLLPVQDDNSFMANLLFLHEFLKNLPTLQANYKSFHTQELHVLEENVWSVYCGITLELFKSRRLWEIPVKVEDMNRLLSFYITLKTDSKASSPHAKFINEVEEFLTTSLYILENQIVFNYTNEDIMNTSLKRLGVIWQIFYQEVYYEVLAMFVPLERSFRVSSKYWLDKTFTDTSMQHVLSMSHIFLRCFRDSIVLPYYQNFINSHDGASKSFQMYIFNEEEENGVTGQDKLTLLQCFGTLSSIQSNDRNQRIIEELLEGIRMSI